MAETRLRQDVSFRIVRTLRDALIVRSLRNSCRHHLTNYREHIGVMRQIRWYLGEYRRRRKSSAYRVYLFFAADGRPVGYGALRLRDDHLYVTECVDPGHRRQGYGTAILSNLISIARHENRSLIAEIWGTNDASLALHKALGFEPEGTSATEGEKGTYHFTAKTQT